MAGLKTLSTRREREIFLDVWHRRDIRSFNRFFDRFNGRGSAMINALEERETGFFIKLFDLAEEEALKRMRG